MEVPSMPEGDFMIGTIRIEDLTITIMNGGPTFALNEAFSLALSCEGQDEVEYYWNALLERRHPESVRLAPRTDSDCHGRSCRRCCHNCSVTPIRSRPDECATR